MVAKYLSTKVFINHRGKKRSFTTEKPGRHRPGQRTKGNVSSTGTNETKRHLIACTENRAWLQRPPPWSKHWTAALCTEPHRPPSPRTPHRCCRHSLSHLRAGGMTTGSAVRCRGPGLGKHTGQHSQPSRQACFIISLFPRTDRAEEELRHADPRAHRTACSPTDAMEHHQPLQMHMSPVLQTVLGATREPF